MKTLITNYTFDASAKTITFAQTFVLEQILLVTNVTDGIIIYNFSNPAMGGTLVDNVLTLEYDTTSMDDADSLQIYADTMESDIASYLNEVVRLLSLMRNDCGMADSAGRVRVAIETGSVGISSSQTLTTVTTLSNQTSSGGYQTSMATFASSNNSPKFNRQYISVT